MIIPKQTNKNRKNKVMPHEWKELFDIKQYALSMPSYRKLSFIAILD